MVILLAGVYAIGQPIIGMIMAALVPFLLEKYGYRGKH